MDEMPPSNEGTKTPQEELDRCRRTMEALRAASAYNRSLIEAIPDALFTIGTTGTITDVNGSAEAMLGLPRQVLLGSDFATHFTDPERVRRASRHTLRHGLTRDRRFEVLPSDGYSVAAASDMVRLKDERGRAIGLLVTMWHVADARRTAEERSQLNRRNQAILDATGTGIYSVDLRGRCTFVNPTLRRMLGYEDEELLGLSPHETFHRHRPDGTHYPEAECPLHRGHDTPLVSRGSDEFFQRKDGSMFPVEYVRTPILGNGWVEGAVVTFWDITGRKRIEEALAESEAKFRTVYDSNAIPLAFWQTGGRITEANDAYLELIGYSREQLNEGQVDWSALTPPEFRHLDQRVLDQFAHGKLTATPYEKEYVRRDGRRIPVLIGSTQFPGKGGGVVFAIDLTERKRMEEAVRMANAYNRSLIDANLDPVFVTGPNGRITDLNAAVETATGYIRRALIGTGIAELFTDPAHARALYHRALREGAVRDQELALRHRDGHTMPVLYNATVYRDNLGKVLGIFAAARDITKRKQQEEALHRRELEFEALAERAPDIIARVNAELRLSYINPAVERLTGQPRAWFLGKTQGELGLSAEEVAQREQSLKRVFESGRQQVREYRHVTPAGTFHFQSRQVPEFGPDGRVESVLVVDRDITDLKRAQQALEKLALLDPLTGIGNRRSLEQFIGREWRREARHRHPVALIMADIDHFKAYNDRYGHPQGDECLRQVAGALRQSLHRPDDAVVRYGGEEFAILLPETEGAAARELAERLRQAVANLQLAHAASPVADRVTISLGVAAIKADEGEFRDLMAAADAALYRAKRNGRNRVETSP